MDLNQVAKMLFEAQENARGIRPVIELVPGLTVEDAYKIQMINIKKRIESGRRIVGEKIGLTSLAMQKLLGVNEPDYGIILDDMLFSSGKELDSSRMVSPKVEGEIAFLLREELSGPDATVLDVFNAVSCIIPAIEIVDSRVSDWKITLADTVADNASSCALIMGENEYDPRDFDLVNIGMYLEKNGQLCNSGAGIEVMGNPAAAVAWLANKLFEYGMTLRAGDIVLSGALTGAQAANKGDRFTVSFDRMSKVKVSFA